MRKPPRYTHEQCLAILAVIDEALPTESGARICDDFAEYLQTAKHPAWEERKGVSLRVRVRA